MANLLPRILTKFSNLSLNGIRNVNKNLSFKSSVTYLSSQKYSTEPTPYEIVDEKKEGKLVNDVIGKINTQVANSKCDRLFAVVHLAGKQFKITEGDVVVVEGYWPPECGDKLSLDKVMLVGATDFTLIGRPIVQKGLVNVQATVIEKTLSHTKTHFRKKRRKQYMRINFYKIPQTFLRINTIKITGEINNPAEIRGLEKVVFM